MLGWPLLQCVYVGFPGFPLHLVPGCLQEEQSGATPHKGALLVRGSHWPSFAPLQEVGEFKGE